MTIEELQLEPIAEQAARLLKQKHPNIEFTSGRRDVRQQAQAMASNIVALKMSSRRSRNGGIRMGKTFNR